MNKSLKILLATALWTLLLLPAVGVAGYLSTWAFDRLAGLYFPDAVAFTSLWLSIAGLVGARLLIGPAERVGLRARAASASAALGRAAKVAFRFGWRRAIDAGATAASPASVSGGAAQGARLTPTPQAISPEAEREALAKIHSVISGDLFGGRSFVEEASTVYAERG